MANLTKKVLVAFCLFGFGIALKAQQTVAVAGQTTDTMKLAVTSLFGPPPDSQDKRESKAYSEWLFAHHDEGLMGIKNNRKTHEMIVKKYPGTDGARRAQRWLDDDKAAFLVSCDVGTSQAVRCFIEAYPMSRLVPLAKDYIEWRRVFLRQKKFIAEHPDNAFYQAALAITPVSWLKGMDAKVGVEIKVGEVVSKGLLGGTSNKQKIRNKLWETYGEQLVRGGVNAVLVESPPDSTNSNLTHIMVIEYKEEASPQMNMGSSFHDAAVQNLSTALLSTACKTVHWSIKDASASDEPIFSGSGSEDDFIPVATLSAITGLKTSSEIRVAALVLSAVYKRDEVGSMRVLAEYLQENQSR